MLLQSCATVVLRTIKRRVRISVNDALHPALLSSGFLIFPDWLLPDALYPTSGFLFLDWLLQGKLDLITVDKYAFSRFICYTFHALVTVA